MCTVAAAVAGGGQAAGQAASSCKLAGAHFAETIGPCFSSRHCYCLPPAQSTSTCESRSWAACGAFSHWI